MTDTKHKNPINEVKDDPVYGKAVALVVRHNQISLSFLQAHLNINYNKAAWLIDRLEERFVISRHIPNKPRRILINEIEHE